MNFITVSSSDLKNKTAEILNLVAFGKAEITIKRHGEPLVKIIPYKKTLDKNINQVSQKYFGASPNFPQVSSTRSFDKRTVDL